MAQNLKNPRKARAAAISGAPSATSLASTELLNSILHNLKEIVFQTDTEGQWLFLNHAWEEVLGHSVQESLGKVFQEYVYPEDRQRNQALFESLIQRKKEFCRHEIRYLTKDGGSKWVEVFARLGLNENNEVIGTYGTLTDITERKEAESKLALSEEQFKLIAENTSDGIVVFNAKNQVVYESPAYLKQMGFADGKSARTPEAIYALTHEDDRDALFARIYQAIEAKQDSLTYQYRLKHKEGHFIWREDSARFMYDDSGKHTGTYVVCRDITERKKTQQLLETNKNILDTTHDGFWLVDEFGKLLMANKAYADLTGYSIAELTGMHLSQLEANEQSLEEVEAHIAKIIAEGSDTFETKHRHKDGHLIDIEISTSFLRETRQFAVFAREISARKKSELELRIASTAFESLEGILITDADGIVLRVNQAFTETTGYTAEDIVGKTPRILKSGRHDAAFYQEMWRSLSETGRWEGEIWDRRKNGETYPKWLSITAIKLHDGTVSNYVATQTDISARKSAEEAVKHLAYFDALTELPNRRLLNDRLQQAIATTNRTGKAGAILFIDLDNFKSLNDSMGHEVGDILLQLVAQRLIASVREGDTVSRLGGDEFVVVLEGLSEKEADAATQAELIGLKILTALQQPFVLVSYEHWSTCSIGASLFKNQPQLIEDLLKQADIAMYQAKKAGRNTLRFFDPLMQESINVHFALEKELHAAFEAKQFELYYQVQVDNAYRPLGAECLIRWIHPERGLVAPNLFIPLAEEVGLILLMGNWVLETACAQLEKWQPDVKTRQLVLAVNVSAKQFHQKDFAQQVIALVNKYNIDPKLLKLELTESMLVDDVENTIATMNTLRKFGIQFSLDDFGTGYSSLQYLKRLPLDQLKIDLSFVKNIVQDSSDRAIVRTIIAMAQSLNIDVIAEGVEVEEQRQILINKGCIHFQGYLFSKPLPLSKFESLLIEIKEKQAAYSQVGEQSALPRESLMHQRNHHLSAVLDNMPAMIGYWDKNLRNRYGNEAYASWFGVTSTKLLGMNLKDLLGEKLSQLNWPYIEAVLRGERQEFERSIPSLDGKRHRHSLAEYIPDIVAGEVRGFYVHVTDITSIKESREQHQHAEEKLKAVFESNQDAILLADKSGFYDCNQSALTIFDCATKSELLQSHPEAAFFSEVQPAFDFDGIVKSGKFDFESTCKRISSGESFPVRVRLSVMQLGNVPNLQFVIRDITERKREEESLRDSKEAAEVASKAKSTFLSTMSHELRTPMNGVMGMAQLLQMRDLSETDRLEFATTLLSSGQEMVDLITSILEYAKFDTIPDILKPEVRSPGIIVKESAALKKPQAEEKGLTIEASTGNIDGQLYKLDSNRLRQMLGKLLDNAIKFTHSGHIRIEASVIGVEGETAELEFAVVDTGIGIPRDKQNLLFEAFSQVDSSHNRSFGGTGLGLATVKRLAELMNGSVGVESEEGKGARFWFTVKVPKV
jgi:diguanylate cyclase (GGDEF)-like protein/PAS domain S-box-containing protein